MQQKQRQSRTAKQERRDKTYGALEAFPEFLERFTPPAGDFDPRGAWKHSYIIHLFAEDTGAVGFLDLERRPAAGGATLIVASDIVHMNGRQEQKAKLVSEAGKLGSLRLIEIESVSSGQDGQPVSATKLSIRGQVRGDALEWTRGGKQRSVLVKPPVLTNWSLLDTVQRLAPAEKAPIEFTLLDDGDLIKPAQRLVCLGRTSVQVSGGAKLPLDCWEQTGYGVLPTHYWVDERGRLLFAIAGQKAFLYDPDARSHMGGRNRRGRKKT